MDEETALTSTCHDRYQKQTAVTMSLTATNVSLPARRAGSLSRVTVELIHHSTHVPCRPILVIIARLRHVFAMRYQRRGCPEQVRACWHSAVSLLDDRGLKFKCSTMALSRLARYRPRRIGKGM